MLDGRISKAFLSKLAIRRSVLEVSAKANNVIFLKKKNKIPDIIIDKEQANLPWTSAKNGCMYKIQRIKCKTVGINKCTVRG